DHHGGTGAPLGERFLPNLGRFELIALLDASENGLVVVLGDAADLDLGAIVVLVGLGEDLSFEIGEHAAFDAVGLAADDAPLEGGVHSRRRPDNERKGRREEVDRVRGLRIGGNDGGVRGRPGADHAHAHHADHADHAEHARTREPAAHGERLNDRRLVPVAWIDDAGDDVDEPDCLGGALNAEGPVEAPLERAASEVAAGLAHHAHAHAAHAHTHALHAHHSHAHALHALHAHHAAHALHSHPHTLHAHHSHAHALHALHAHHAAHALHAGHAHHAAHALHAGHALHAHHAAHALHAGHATHARHPGDTRVPSAALHALLATADGHHEITHRVDAKDLIRQIAFVGGDFHEAAAN